MPDLTRRYPGLPYLAAAAVFAVAQLVFYRTAWIGDDALITIRSVMNVLEGYGAVYNIGERAQAYTHTTWFWLLVLGTWITETPYTALFAMSFLVNALTFAVIVAGLRDRAWVVLLLLICSKAVVDFANSGLENPLSFLLIALVALALERPDTRRSWIMIGLICSALILTRPDLGLMLIAVAVFRWRRAGFAWIALGLLPLILWEAFSLSYYGALIPNSALAKLNTGLPKYELAVQGIIYVGDMAISDPLGLALIALFLWQAVRNRAMRELAFFTGGYILYTISVGGDFMSGRFFAVPVFTAALGLGVMLRDRALRRPARFTLAGIVVCLLPFNVHANFLAGADFQPRSFWLEGVADERGFYFQDFGLITAGVAGFPDVSDWGTRASMQAPPHQKCGGIGEEGLLRGPGTHMIDTCALTDPLLARLPMVREGFLKWRIGHFYRRPPESYLALVAGEISTLPDAPTEALNRDVELALRSPLDTPGRWGAIWRLNTKDYGLAEAYARPAAPN